MIDLLNEILSRQKRIEKKIDAYVESHGLEFVEEKEGKLFCVTVMDADIFRVETVDTDAINTLLERPKTQIGPVDV